MPDKQAIDDALQEITQTPITCWASRLNEDAFQFLLQLEALERDPTVRVSRKAAAEKFETLFGVSVGVRVLGGHFRKDCGCHKERDY